MTAPARPRFFYLNVAFIAAASVVSFFFLFKLASGLRKESGELDAEIEAQGRMVVERVRQASFAISSRSDLLIPAPGAKEKSWISAAGCFLGDKKLWSFPEGVKLPEFDEPRSVSDEVVAVSSGRRMLVSKIEDGRTIVVVFETPGYRREWRDTALVAFLVMVLVLLGVMLLSYTVKRFRSSQEREAAAGQRAESLGSIDALVIMKKTMAELREKNQLLDSELRKEKKRAKGTAAVLESLTSGLSAGFARLDKDGNLQAFNPVARNLTGLPVLFRIGENYRKIFGRSREITALIEGSMSRRTIMAADAVEGFQGKLLFVLALPILDEMSHFEGVLMIIQDRSDFYAMERAVKEKEALSRIGEVAAGVAHEIRNGLNVLSGELRLLRKDAPESVGERADRIGSEIAQMEKVVKDLLYYARPLALDKEEIGTASFAAEIVDNCREMFPGVEFEVSVGLDSFRADRDSLGRALLNLVMNAAEAAGSGGKVLLSVFPGVPGGTVFRVQDSGPGVSEEAAKDLFTLFATHKKEGTGLGLPIARKIAREHGGDLVLASKGDLQGACFEIII